MTFNAHDPTNRETAPANPPIVPSAGTVSTDELKKLYADMVAAFGSDETKRLLKRALLPIDPHLNVISQLPLHDRPLFLAAVAEELIQYRAEPTLAPEVKTAAMQIAGELERRIK